MSSHRRTRSDSAVAYRNYDELGVIDEDEPVATETRWTKCVRAERLACRRLLASIALPRRLAWITVVCVVVVTCLTRLVFSNSVSHREMWSSAAENQMTFRVFIDATTNATVSTVSIEPSVSACMDCWGKIVECTSVMKSLPGMFGIAYQTNEHVSSMQADLVNTTGSFLGRVSYSIPTNFTNALALSVLEASRVLDGGLPIVDVWLPVVLNSSVTATVRVILFYELWVPGSSYCEALHHSTPILQPANSLSNVGFLFTGAHMLAVGFRDVHHRLSPMSRSPPASLVNGATHIFAGCASFAFHASLAPVPHALDMLAVYMLVINPSIYCLLSVFGWPRDAVGRVLLAAVYSFTAASIYGNQISLQNAFEGGQVLVLSLCALLAVCLAAWIRKNGIHLAFRWLIAAGILIGIAMGARVADSKLCSPSSAFQWHAVWHVGSAASLWCLWAFFRSARGLPEGSYAAGGTKC